MKNKKYLKEKVNIYDIVLAYTPFQENGQWEIYDNHGIIIKNESSAKIRPCLIIKGYKNSFLVIKLTQSKREKSFKFTQLEIPFMIKNKIKSYIDCDCLYLINKKAVISNYIEWGNYGEYFSINNKKIDKIEKLINNDSIYIKNKLKEFVKITIENRINFLKAESKIYIKYNLKRDNHDLLKDILWKTSRNILYLK